MCCSYSVNFSAMVVEHLNEIYGDKSAIAYIYFDYKDQETQDAVNLLANVVKQILSRLDAISDDLLAVLDDMRSQSRHYLDSSKVIEVIRLVAEHLSQTYIIVDALDECRESSTRAHLLESLDQLRSKNIKIYVASRPHIQHIRGAEVLQIRARDTDIETYVRSKLEKAGRVTPALREQIIARLLISAKGTLFSFNCTI
jgi:hypothetical protein